MLVTPKEYLDKLTDYKDDNKQLNLIWAYYLPDCAINIITKVGFGTGILKRFNYNSDTGKQMAMAGVPYQLRVGYSNWTPPLPYQDPGDFLTFRWFKLNIMCQDQPWICYNEET